MKSKNLTNTVLLIAAGVITFIALMLVWVNLAPPFKITNFDRINEVDYSTIYNKTDEEYYVFIYAEGEVFEDDYESIILEYANYKRTHKDATPIYLYDFNQGQNSKIIDDLTGTITIGRSIPGLVKVKNGRIDTQFLSYSKLNNELTKAMEK